MIIDTSAIIAILRAEADAALFAEAIRQVPENERRISAASFLEAAIVIDGARDPIASGRLEELIGFAKITVEPATARQARIARDAYRDFGKGSGHPAALNFGDCFAYALAKEKDEPLLFKGGDFAHTDVRPALR